MSPPLSLLPRRENFGGNPESKNARLGNRMATSSASAFACCYCSKNDTMVSLSVSPHDADATRRERSLGVVFENRIESNQSALAGVGANLNRQCHTFSNDLATTATLLTARKYNNGGAYEQKSA